MGAEGKPCVATLPQLLPRPPSGGGRRNTPRHAAPYHGEDASSARQWQLQMEAAAEKVQRLNKKIHGPAFQEPDPGAALQVELNRQKLKNRQLRTENRELRAQISAGVEKRGGEKLELNPSDDETSTVDHLRDRREIQGELEQANGTTQALRSEVAARKREIAELHSRLRQLAPGPEDMVAEMRALNMKQLQLHSARQARELERAQLDLLDARKALLDSPRLAGAQEPGAASKQLEQLTAKLAESQEHQQRLQNERNELVRELESLRADRVNVDGVKKLNALRARSAMQEANVSRARRALDEYKENVAEHAATSHRGAKESTRQWNQEQGQLDRFRT